MNKKPAHWFNNFHWECKAVLTSLGSTLVFLPVCWCGRWEWEHPREGVQIQGRYWRRISRRIHVVHWIRSSQWGAAGSTGCRSRVSLGWLGWWTAGLDVHRAGPPQVGVGQRGAGRSSESITTLHPEKWAKNSVYVYWYWSTFRIGTPLILYSYSSYIYNVPTVVLIVNNSHINFFAWISLSSDGEIMLGYQPIHILQILFTNSWMRTRPFKIECVFCIRKFWKLNARARKHNTNPRNLHKPLWSKVTWFQWNR